MSDYPVPSTFLFTKLNGVIWHFHSSLLGAMAPPMPCEHNVFASPFLPNGNSFTKPLEITFLACTFWSNYYTLCPEIIVPAFGIFFFAIFVLCFRSPIHFEQGGKWERHKNYILLSKLDQFSQLLGRHFLAQKRTFNYNTPEIRTGISRQREYLSCFLKVVFLFLVRAQRSWCK